MKAKKKDVPVVRAEAAVVCSIIHHETRFEVLRTQNGLRVCKPRNNGDPGSDRHWQPIESLKGFVRGLPGIIESDERFVAEIAQTPNDDQPVMDRKIHGVRAFMAADIDLISTDGPWIRVPTVS